MVVNGGLTRGRTIRYWDKTGLLRCSTKVVIKLKNAILIVMMFNESGDKAKELYFDCEDFQRKW